MRPDVDKAAVRATLDMLLRALAAPPPEASPRPASSPPPDALIAAYQGAKATLRDLAARDPIDALVGVVGPATVLFYLAEKGKNPKVNDLWDAFTFITTCLSVGYHNIFPETAAGKAIASFVMTVGPSLSSHVFDPPRAEAERDAAAAGDKRRSRAAGP